MRLGFLPLTRGAQQETACGATLNVALRKGGGVGEVSIVEGIIGIQVQRLQSHGSIGQ